MNTHDRLSIRPVDIHAALARAHADRAEYVRSALWRRAGAAQALGGQASPPAASRRLGVTPTISYARRSPQ